VSFFKSTLMIWPEEIADSRRISPEPPDPVAEFRPAQLKFFGELFLGERPF
jgi:hypothetical protein